MRRFSTSALLFLALSLPAARAEVAGSSRSCSTRDSASYARHEIDNAGVTYRASSKFRPRGTPAYYSPGAFIPAAAVRAQKPLSTVTMTLGPDQIGKVKTAQGIITRMVFPETVTQIVCGDLYDPASGKGTFVVENSGNDVFLKPVVPKAKSNLFVMTGGAGTRRLYSFDLDVVSSAAQANRVVNVLDAFTGLPPAPEAPVGPTSTRPPAEIKSDSPRLPRITGITFSEVEAPPSATAPPFEIGGTPPPEPPPREPPAQDSATEAAPPTVIRLSGGVLAGEAIRRPEPSYPARAKAEGVSGAVVVEVTVDESGDVIEARAISGHPLLQDAAVRAARLWKYNPTRLSGRPIKVTGTITFNFRL